MSRNHDHLHSIEARGGQKNAAREPIAHRGGEQLNLLVVDHEEQEGLLRAEELAAQARSHEAAIARAHKRALEETRLAEEQAALLVQEARLELFARERGQAEQAERVALAARIEAERRLALQIEARAEQEKIERDHASRRAGHEELLRKATAEREAQERQLRIEELAAQACSHEAAIAEARLRAAEETRRAEEQAALLEQEVRLEALAKKRVQTEHAEQAALAARTEAERRLAAQVEARIEHEQIGRAQAAQRAAHEERLRVATAEREELERLLQAEERAAQTPRHGTAFDRRAGKARRAEGNAAGVAAVAFIRPPSPYLNRRYLAYFVVLLLLIGAGLASLQLSGIRADAASARPSADTVSAGIAANSPAPEIRTTAVQAGAQATVAVKPQQRAEAEIRQMVMQWVKAWSRRDAAAYLAFYAADFNLPEGMRRADWEVQRQLRLQKYHSIKVSVRNMKISYPGEGAASVRFDQDFRADRYRETGIKKELHLKNIQGRWLIVGEKNA